MEESAEIESSATYVFVDVLWNQSADSYATQQSVRVSKLQLAEGSLACFRFFLAHSHMELDVCTWTYLNVYLRCVRWRNAPVSRVSTIHFSVNFRKDDDDMVKSCRPCEARGNG